MGENERIRIVKEKLGLSQLEIGDATGMSATSIGRFLNGKAHPSESWIERFCVYYHVDKDWLVSGAGEFTGEKKENNVGARLKEMRKELGLKQKDVCEVLGITKSTYARIETSRVCLSEKYAKKIEERYGYGVRWILFGDEEKKEYPVIDKMIEYLWKNEEERKKLWEKMRTT